MNHALGTRADTVDPGSSCCGLEFSERYLVTIWGQYWRASGRPSAADVEQKCGDGRERGNHANRRVRGIARRTSNVPIERDQIVVANRRLRLGKASEHQY